MARRKQTVRKGTEPDFILKMKSRDPENKAAAPIGAGWINSKGGIGIKISIGVVLSHRDQEDYILTLWPNNNLAEAMIDSLEEEDDD